MWRSAQLGRRHLLNEREILISSLVGEVLLQATVVSMSAAPRTIIIRIDLLSISTTIGSKDSTPKCSKRNKNNTDRCDGKSR